MKSKEQLIETDEIKSLENLGILVDEDEVLKRFQQSEEPEDTEDWWFTQLYLLNGAVFYLLIFDNFILFFYNLYSKGCVANEF